MTRAHCRGLLSGRDVLVLLVPLLAAYNNVVLPAVPGYPRTVVPANLAAAAAVLVLARAGGLGLTELGLDRRTMRAGARWGAAAALLVAAGYATALVVPALRPLLLDARVAGYGPPQVRYDVLVRIPLATVLWEELAFRGVLLAALLRVLSPVGAVAGSSLLFGMWHIRPTADAVSANAAAGTGAATVAVVVAACAGTALAGALLGGLRLRTGSLLAPVLLHLASNDLGTLAAVAAHRLERG